MKNRDAQQRAPLTARAASDVLWALRGLPTRPARRLERWLDALEGVPLAEWLRIAEHSAALDHAMPGITTARAHVDDAIAAHDLHVTAWLIRDLVETAVHRVRRQASHEPASRRSRLVLAHIGAEWAALGIATELWIEPDDCEALYAAFPDLFGRLRDSFAS